MADFNKPTNDGVYVDIMDDIVSNQNANAVMFNGVVANNVPVNTVQYAGGVFGLWNGVSFAPTSVAISGGGTGATTAAGARANLGISSNAEFDAKYMSQDANGSDIDDKSIFRSEIDVYSTAQVNAKTIINNTLTSTSTSQSLSAAQGKVLKDAQVYYNSATLGASGGFTGGSCKIVRVGDIVTVSGSYTHLSGTPIPATSVGAMPDWSRPSINIFNTYNSQESRTMLIETDGQLRMLTSNTFGYTDTSGFAISYTV
jgi:hypothetical protein